MFSLAHISDVHLGPLPPVSAVDLVSKRITGFANWKLKRAKNLGSETLNALIADIKLQQPNHIAITGDLVNLALPAEFEASKAWLQTLGSSDHISVVPGNHDAYVKDALLNAHRAWGGYMPVSAGSSITTKSLNSSFPYVRRIGPLAIIGVSSAIASAPFLAIGRFQSEQAKRLTKILLDTGHEGLFRVVLIHHPPFRYVGDVTKRLYGVRLFQKTLLDTGAELVLHGHTHITSKQLLANTECSIPIIGVPSASQSLGGHRPAARWNEFKIFGQKGRWDVQFSERGIQTNGEVGPIGSTIRWENGHPIKD